MAAERREHRVALEILYAIDVGKTSLEDALRQARENVGVFNRGDDAASEDPYEPQYPAINERSDAPRATDWQLVEMLVRGTLAHKAALQVELTPFLRRWSFERLSGIDRLILEMSAYELRHRAQADTLATINHAVELARRLSTAQSGQFVNAVLDTLAKSTAAPINTTP